LLSGHPFCLARKFFSLAAVFCLIRLVELSWPPCIDTYDLPWLARRRMGVGAELIGHQVKKVFVEQDLIQSSRL